jgi:cytochrome P450
MPSRSRSGWAAEVIDRYATRDIEPCGAQIKRGDLVTVSIAGANRDPALFADPDRFDIRRGNATLNLAFAQGPHFCLGAQLARIEITIALHRLLDVASVLIQKLAGFELGR